MLVDSYDVLGQPIGPIFKGQAAQEEFFFVPQRWKRQVVPKHP